MIHAPFFQWIGYLATNEEMVVRFHQGVPVLVYLGVAML